MTLPIATAGLYKPWRYNQLFSVRIVGNDEKRCTIRGGKRGQRLTLTLTLTLTLSPFVFKNSSVRFSDIKMMV
jgi:hypothetical protein